MCAFLYIQNSEAAIRGFLPKNTDVEKTERAQEIFDSTHRLTDKNEEIYLLNSLSLSLCFVFVGFCLKISLDASHGAPNIQKDKSVLQVTNVTSLGERKRVWRSVTFFCYSGSLYRQNRSVRFSPCRGRQMIGQDPSRPFADKTISGTARGENLSYHHHCHIMLFWKKRTTNIDNDTTMHSPTPERERWLAKEESCSPNV